MRSWCTLRALFGISLTLQLFFGAAQCRNYKERHNRRHGHISRFHEYDSNSHYRNQRFNTSKAQDVRQVYYTYQKGLARIPFHGANVNVHAFHTPKKMYKGTVVTTILDDRLANSRRRIFSGKHRHGVRDNDGELSSDEPSKVIASPCAKCPSNRAVIAKRGSKTAIMEQLPITPCYPWSTVEEIEQEVVLGPAPGQIITEGTHSLVVRLTHHERTISTCHVMYSVIVRKCAPIEPEGLLKVHCPQGEAWGATCYFSCPEGYQLIGTNSSKCDDQLEWNYPLPFCSAATSCTVPVTPENGHITCRTPQYRLIKSQNILPDGTVCHYWCSTGFQIPSSQIRLATVQCFAGHWNNTQDPTCIESNAVESQKNDQRNNYFTTTRFGRKHCPRSLCHNGGKCFIVLSEPFCLCQNGFTGTSCTELLEDNVVA